MDGYNCNRKLTQFLWKKGWLQILVSKKHTTLENNMSLQLTSWNEDGNTQIHGCKCSFEITIRRISIEVRLAAVAFVKQRNTRLWQNLVPSIKRSNVQEENIFLGTTTLDHSLFLWAAISLRFLYLYFGVYKLIGWNPVSITCSK